MMRFIFFFLISLNVFASDLEDGDRARFNYEKTSVYKILSANYHSEHLRIKALVEGNICRNSSNSLGTFEVHMGDKTMVHLLVRHFKTNDQVMCAQYSKEVSVHAKIRVALQEGETKVFELDGNTITLQERGGKWEVTIVNQESIL